MAKISLANIASGFNLTKVNDNFKKIEDALNTRVLYRNNLFGEDNTLTNDLDINGRRLYNLPAPAFDNEPARLQDVKNATAGLAATNANMLNFGPFEDLSATNVQGAFKQLNDKVDTYGLSVKKFGAKGDGVTDDTAAFKQAIANWADTGLQVIVPRGVYKISDSLDLRGLSGFILRGIGLPRIVMYDFTKPIFLVGGERLELTGMYVQYASRPLVTDTNAVAIRAYNLYESIFDRLFIYQVYAGIDQYQGLVNGGQNAFYSNEIKNIRIVNFSGWAILLQPYGGGNSGSVWTNVYINNRSGVGAVDSLPCLGGVNIQTAQNDVFNLLNIEWMRYAGAALVLNQAGNPTFNGLHMEGLYGTSSYQPVIDVIGGDASALTINGLSVVGCDWGGAVGQCLFRLSGGAPSRSQINGFLAVNNINQGNIQLLSNGGPTAYGSFIEFNNANVDGSFASDPYSPKVSYGTYVPGVEVPLQRWNASKPSHGASVQDNAGGTQTAGGMSGTLTHPAFDPMGLWGAGDNRFNIKATGTYLITLNIPTGVNPIVYVQRNYSNAAALNLSSGYATAVVQLNRGDNIEFYLADGSYTRTNVTLSVSLLN